MKSHAYVLSALEAPKVDQSDLVDSTYVLAVKDQDVECGREGQRGQKALHGKILRACDLRCACLTSRGLN